MAIGMSLDLATGLLGFSTEERQRIDSQQFALCQDLREAIGESEFFPQTACSSPGCLGMAEAARVLEWIRAGMPEAPLRCLVCTASIVLRPYLRRAGFFTGSAMELPLYRAEEALERLRAQAETPFSRLRSEYGGLYHSTILQFGGLREGFVRLGVTYADVASLDWRVQVESFLGALPDAVIARIVHAPVGEIRKRRQRTGKPAYTRRGALEGLVRQEE
jgi:hypothetical protein